ncbi:hypothetical protein ACLESO_28020 [Pyxidicoccus sp. 3LG]
MSLLKSGGVFGLVLLVLGSAAGGAYLYHRYRDSDWERREAEYQRQLQGHLTTREKEIEALNTQLGTARSQLVTQDDLDKKYTALLTARDADFEKFRREHQLALKSISASLFELKQRGEDGMEEAHVVSPPPASGSDAGTAPDAKPVIAYAFADKEGRVHLTDPDIWVQGDEELEMKQFFRVKGTVVQQQDGSLMAERIQLMEVFPDGTAGQYRELAEASLVDANFTYANAPQEGPPSRWVKWGPGWMATVGTSFRTERVLRFGASASLVRLGDVGLAGGLSSDFDSLEGSGGDAVVTYTPSYKGRQLGVALGGGVHLPLGGSTRVRPNLTLNFIVY